MAALDYGNITLNTFKTILARYADTAPSSLAELDTFRYETVPARLASMKGDTHLLKADVERLVEWKLKHGTFRPSLMNLVKSNPADLIKSTTQSAFSILSHSNDPLQALKLLTKLRGIGPATASLLLSVYQSDAVPFFSDELFQWTHWDGTGAAAGGTKAGEGWQRKIKYNVKEYGGIVDRVGHLRDRLGVRAVEAEQVAYVLGKEMADVDGGVGVGNGGNESNERNEEQEGDKKHGRTEKELAGGRIAEVTKAIRDAEAEAKGKDNKNEHGPKHSGAPAAKESEKKGTKRKAREQKALTEGTRRSTRRKT